MGCGDRGYIGRKPRSNVAVRFAVASIHPTYIHAGCNITWSSQDSYGLN